MRRRSIALMIPCLGNGRSPCLVCRGGPGQPPAAPSGDELEQVERSIRDCIGWAKTKDFGLLHGVVADDADFLEVHPDGRVVKGIEEFRKAEAVWRSPDFKAIRYEIRGPQDQAVGVRRRRLVLLHPRRRERVEGEAASWEDTRWTGVLEKRKGRWVIVQQHFSFGEKR